MAQPYLKQLQQLVDRLELRQLGSVSLECKHFFSGAALYADRKIVVTLSPAGLAIKLPQDKRKALIGQDLGSEFRFFDGGPIKKEYVALSQSVIESEASLRELIERSIEFVLND